MSTFTMRPFDAPIKEDWRWPRDPRQGNNYTGLIKWSRTMQQQGQATGGGYSIMPLPKVSETMPKTTQPATPTATGLPDISSLLSGDVFGIPIKYLLIGVAAYFLMRK